MVRYLEDDYRIQRFIYLLFNSIRIAYDNYFIKDKNGANFMILKNHIIFFMIICLNLKNNEKLNYYLFKEKIEFISCLISDIENLKEEDKKVLSDILYNLFSTEYIYLDLSLLVLNNEKDKNKSHEIIKNFYKRKKEEKKDDELEEKRNKKIVKFLFDLKSISFLNFQKLSIEDIEERFYHQLDTVQSIILILFSKEKYKFLKEDNNIFYEYDFLNKVILKNLLDTKKVNGDSYKSLFRQESLSNDIIKYLFFIFGNQMLVESLVKPLNIILEITGINNEFEIISNKATSMNRERDILKEEFNILFDKILEQLSDHLPYALKIFLRMIYENVRKNYTIERNNFIPLGVVLIFNYIANPRIQKVYSIHPHKYNFIKSVNRLLCNICFKMEFNDKDPLRIFNEDIKEYNKKLNSFFQNNIMNIDLNNNENKRYFKNIFNEMNVEYPTFLFNLDCEFLNNISKI